jgi:hypothetical protein
MRPQFRAAVVPPTAPVAATQPAPIVDPRFYFGELRPSEALAAAPDYSALAAAMAPRDARMRPLGTHAIWRRFAARFGHDYAVDTRHEVLNHRRKKPNVGRQGRYDVTDVARYTTIRIHPFQ